LVLFGSHNDALRNKLKTSEQIYAVLVKS